MLYTFTSFRYLLIVIILLTITTAHAYAQQSTLNITTINASKQTVEATNIIIKNAKDSSIVKQLQTNSKGLATIQLSANKTYIITTTSVGYLPTSKVITMNKNILNYTLNLTTNTTNKGIVTVTAKKPIMRQEDDKTIVDAEVLASTSTNAYEVLEKTPGAIVDQDGNVYMASMQPAAIFINGREVKLSAADLASLLKSLPANAVSKIEMTRSPSAKYDAASSGGILNIVLKKGVKLGTNGSVNMSHFQGVYGTTSTGFNANKNDDKGNFNFNYQYTTRNSFERLQTNRQFTTDPTYIDQLSYTTYPTQNHYISTGYDKDITKQFTLGIETRLTLNNGYSKGSNITDIKTATTNATIATNGNLTNNTNATTNWNNSLTGKYKIDTLGSEFTFNLDYNYYKGNVTQLFNNYFIQPSITTLFGDGLLSNDKKTITLQTDLKYKLPKKLTLETGLKLNYVQSDNATNYFSRQGSTPRIVDTKRTNSFEYNENINALYGQVTKTFKGNFVIKAGVRVESTDMQGNQIIPRDTTFAIKRTDAFPYLYLSKGLVKMLGFDLMANLVVRKTINRPFYENLNPFPRFVDQYLTESGNPALTPQFTNNYEVNITASGFPFLSVGYNDTKDIFSQVTYQDDVTKVANRTYDNLGTNKEVYFRAFGGIPPGGKYVFFIGAQHNFNIYEGVYQNSPLNFRRGTWTFFSYQQYKVNKTLTVNMNGFMRTKGVFNFYELQNFGQLGLSATKTLNTNKFALTLALNDIFRTNKIDFALQQGTILATGKRLNDTRRVGLTLRYNFGIKPKEKQENMMDNKVPE